MNILGGTMDAVAKLCSICKVDLLCRSVVAAIIKQQAVHLNR